MESKSLYPEKVVAVERLERNDLQFVQGALTKTIANARMVSNGQFGGSSTILIEDEDGWNITGVALIEQRLSDGSKVYNARLDTSAPIQQAREGY